MTWTDREGPIHRAILDHLRARFPGCIVHHSPNELALRGKHVSRQIAKAKHNGMVPGFPDLVAFTPHGAFLFEVKAEGGRLTEAQKAVGAALASAGHPVGVVRSIEDVDECLAEWGAGNG